MSAPINHDAFNEAQAIQIYRQAMLGFTPPEQIRLSEWIEKHFVGDSGSKLRLTEFQKQIADIWDAPALERLVIMKSARVGFSMLLSAITAHGIAEKSVHVAIVQPRDTDSRGFSAEIIEPALKNCAPAAKKLAQATVDNLLLKLMGSTSLRLLAAQSPANFRRVSVDWCLLDEVSAFPITKEGNPIRLAEKRATNSSQKKVLIGSTPTDETSLIAEEYESTDQREFHICCVHCGSFFAPEWRHVMITEPGHLSESVQAMNPKEWTRKRIDDAEVTLRCPHCSEDIHEGQEKQATVDAGEFIATRPGNASESVVGLFVNALVSPFPNSTWKKLTHEWMAAKRDGVDGIAAFYNTVLGLTFSGAIEELSVEALAARKAPGNLDLVPADILCLTAGVDVQGNRLEMSSIGWKEDGSSAVLAHEILYGDTSEDPASPTGVWEKFRKAARRKFQSGLGGEIGYSAVAVDSGYNTDTVYRAVAPLHNCYAVKGATSVEAPIWKLSKKKLETGQTLYNIGTHQAKTFIMSRLSLPAGDPGCIMFAEALCENKDYLSQVLSEKRVLRKKNGRMVWAWEASGKQENRDHEGLDCAVYAVAAFKSLGISGSRWQEIRESMTVQHGAPAATQKKQSALERIAAAAAVLNG